MQIALTKKLAKAMGVKPPLPDKNVAPLFSWTANWTNTFDDGKDDMVIMVNNATRFTVAIYGVRRNKFKGIAAKMLNAINNTLHALNINPEIIAAYLEQGGEINYAKNSDRKLTAWVNHQGLEAAFVVGNEVIENSCEINYDDTLGRLVSDRLVNYSNSQTDGFVPLEKMIDMLTKLTGKPAYKYRAYEIRVTLDLGIYKAIRRLIIPADLELIRLHKVLQEAYGWRGSHLYDFTVFEKRPRVTAARLVAGKDDLFYDENATLIAGHRLSEYLPKYEYVLYTYDFGDHWKHEIELVRIIEDYNKESPCLLEAKGQTPPEDVGGIGGYIEFREIMLNPEHPEHEERKKWAGFWSPELTEWESHPRLIRG